MSRDVQVKYNDRKTPREAHEWLDRVTRTAMRKHKKEFEQSLIDLATYGTAIFPPSDLTLKQKREMLGQPYKTKRAQAWDDMRKFLSGI